MDAMTSRSAFLGGIGTGLLIAALTIRLFDAEWLVVSLGALLLIVAGLMGSRRDRPSLGSDSRT